MTIRNLEGLFQPKSVVVLGPNRLSPAALTTLARHLGSSPKRPLAYVGLEAADLPEGATVVARLADLSFAPDLAVLLSGPEDAPATIDALGRAGARAAVFLSQGYCAWDRAHLDATLAAARPYTLRVLGPGSLGLVATHAGLDASLAARQPKTGDLAVVSRSASVVNATLAWGEAHHVGFSAVVSLGQKADVDIGDLLDWFAADYRTKAVLVHLEAITSPAKFMSAARACARTKPVVVIRSGASRDEPAEGASHSTRLATPDAVYDAAFRRAGLLRVDSIDDLFDAAETVSKVKAGSARALAVLANGRSLATVAADHLERLGGTLATLSAETEAAIAHRVRSGAGAGNPVTLDDDAGPADYAAVIEALAVDPGVDAVLVVHSPTAFVGGAEIADQVAATAKGLARRIGRKRPILAALLDEHPEPRETLEDAGIPCHGTPEEAVKSFVHLTRWAEAQERLTATPAALDGFEPETERARGIVRAALAEGRSWLSPRDVRTVLECYRVPVAASRFCRTPEEAVEAAREIFAGFAKVVLKVASPDMPFKSDKGGVVLDLASTRQVSEAAAAMLKRFEDHRGAGVEGVVVMPMVERKGAVELIAGLADDPVFGPVVVFGQGGRSVEVVADRALELAPLDMNLAEAMIGRTRVAKVLSGYRSTPPVDRVALSSTLVKLSRLAVDIPEIRDLDLNPILADKDGVVAVDSRIRIAPIPARMGRLGNSRLVIRPYPTEWERDLELKDGRVWRVRPIRPEDEPAYRDFFAAITPEDLRLRFFAPVKDFNHAFLAKLTQLDYARAMALGAFDPKTGALMGVVRLHADPDHKTGEYAILVRSNLKGLGLGWSLMELVIEYARADGIETIKGEVLRENRTMLKMCEALGFSIKSSPDDEAVALVTLPVDTPLTLPAGVPRAAAE